MNAKLENTWISKGRKAHFPPFVYAEKRSRRDSDTLVFKILKTSTFENPARICLENTSSIQNFYRSAPENFIILPPLSLGISAYPKKK